MLTDPNPVTRDPVTRDPVTRDSVTRDSGHLKSGHQRSGHQRLGHLAARGTRSPPVRKKSFQINPVVIISVVIKSRCHKSAEGESLCLKAVKAVLYWESEDREGLLKFSSCISSGSAFDCASKLLSAFAVCLSAGSSGFLSVFFLLIFFL